jgi:hypothetical protein
MPVNLPLEPSNASYQVVTTLDGANYIFDVRWNPEDPGWFIDVSDAVGDQIAIGLKVVLGVVLGRRITDSRIWPGMLIAVDTSNAGLDAGLDDLGGRVQVQYYTIAELIALGLGGS